MRKHKVLILIALATFSRFMSVAEVPDTTHHVLQEIVVTAGAAPKEALSTAPIRIASDEEMRRSGVSDVSDALHRMPGVTLRDYGGAGGMKTVAVRGFGATHTGVFFDGVPLSNMQSGQIDLSRYSVDNVKSVSLIIGDNDDIFIPARLAASAATVKISSMPVSGESLLTAKMRFGSFGYYNPYLKVGIPMGNRVAMNVIGEFVHADNDYPFDLKNGTIVTREKRTNSRMNSGHGEINLQWKINSGNRLNAKLYYFNSARHLPGPVIYYNNVSHERLHDENAMAQAEWQSSLTNTLNLKGIMKFNYSSSLYHDENGKYPGGILDQNYYQREYYTSWALLYSPFDNWSFDYSADYFFNNLNSNLISDRRPYRNSVLQSLTAKYKIRNLTLTGRLLASLYYNGAQKGEASKNASKLSPSVSASWQPIESQLLFVRASYKNIFRMPTFNEAYFDHYGSIDILPENTDQINVGFTYTLPAIQWLPTATFTLDGYMNNIRDMIVGVPYNMFIWRMTNLGKARTLGIDATAMLTFRVAAKHDIHLSANYSLQRAMPRTNPESSDWMKQVAYIPLHSGSAAVSYENPWVNLSFSGSGVSERFTTNNNQPDSRIAGYMEFGASAWRSFQIKRDSIEVRADVQNLFNKQYCIVARYPMPGRQYRITLTYNY